MHDDLAGPSLIMDSTLCVIIDRPCLERVCWVNFGTWDPLSLVRSKLNEDQGLRRC